MSWNTLSSAANLEAVLREATADMTPEYVAILRQLRPGVKLHQAFGLWRAAREALYRQELAQGNEPDEAMRIAADRLLHSDDDSAP